MAKKNGVSRRKYWKRKAGKYCGSVAGTVYRLQKTVRYVTGLINSEKYIHDVTGSDTTDNTGTIVHLTGIAQGDGSGNRTGISIFLRNLFGRLVLEKNASATFTKYRIIFFFDKQQIADTAPSVTDVLSSASTIAPLSETSLGRFKIIFDRHWVLHADAPTRFVKIRKVFRRHVRYNGAAATDQQKGALYMLIISSEATNTPTINYDLRLRYHDN